MNDLNEILYKKAEAIVGFRIHLRIYLAVNGLIWLLWYYFRASNGHYDGYWPAYPTLGWGFGLFSHFLGVYGNSTKAINKEYERLKRKNEIKG